MLKNTQWIPIYLYIQCLVKKENLTKSVDGLNILFHNLFIYSPFNGYFILIVMLQQALLSLYFLERELRVGCSVPRWGMHKIFCFLCCQKHLLCVCVYEKRERKVKKERGEEGKGRKREFLILSILWGYQMIVSYDGSYLHVWLLINSNIFSSKHTIGFLLLGISLHK